MKCVELLIGDSPPKHGSEKMTEILSHYDNCADFFASVKSKAGVEKLKNGNKHYHRTSDGTLDFIEKSGTSLLRRSSEAASMDKVLTYSFQIDYMI